MALWEHILNALKHALVSMACCMLPWLIFAGIMQFLSSSLRNSLSRILGGSDCFAALTAPGVVVHELGHAFLCLVFGHKIVKMELYSPRGDGGLGYVRHAYGEGSICQSMGNFFIGTGPIWFGTACLVAQSYALLPDDMLVFSRGCGRAWRHSSPRSSPRRFGVPGKPGSGSIAASPSPPISP